MLTPVSPLIHPNRPYHPLHPLAPDPTQCNPNNLLEKSPPRSTTPHSFQTSTPQNPRPPLLLSPVRTSLAISTPSIQPFSRQCEGPAQPVSLTLKGSGNHTGLFCLPKNLQSVGEILWTQLEGAAVVSFGFDWGILYTSCVGCCGWNVLW